MKENNFVPDYILLKHIALLDKCKCDECQSEKRKYEDRLSKK